MQDFQTQEVIACQSSFRRHSCLGYPQLAIRTGEFGLSALRSFLFHRFSYRLYEFVITDKSTIIIYLFFHTMGFRHFPKTTHNRSLKLAFGKPSLYLISDYRCGSVVSDCLWITYRFPFVLCSRFSFRLSVRTVVFRVILRCSSYTAFLISLSGRTLWICPRSVCVAHSTIRFFLKTLSAHSTPI